MKPLYDLLHDKIKFQKNDEMETLFKQIETVSTKDVVSQTIHGSYPSLSKQSLNNSLFQPPFFKYISKFIEIFLPPDTPVKIENKNEISNWDHVLSNVYNWIS